MGIIVVSLCFLLLGTAVAFRDYQEHIPNGDRVPDSCHPNKLWQGVGHEQVSGGGDRNPFGKDFKEAGKVKIPSKAFSIYYVSLEYLLDSTCLFLISPSSIQTILTSVTNFDDFN